MLRWRLVLSAALLVPVTLSAQRGGGRVRGTPRPNYDAMLNDDRGGKSRLSRKDMEGISPVKALMDKKKALALTDSEMDGLKALAARLKTTNDTLLKQVDSLRAEMNPSTTLSPEVDRIRVRGVRNALLEVVKAIRANYDTAADEALGLLDEAQRKTGNELLDKKEQEAEAMIQEKLGGGSRRGG